MFVVDQCDRAVLNLDQIEIGDDAEALARESAGAGVDLVIGNIVRAGHAIALAVNALVLSVPFDGVQALTETRSTHS